jgi:hypothetical protein
MYHARVVTDGNSAKNKINNNNKIINFDCPIKYYLNIIKFTK